MKAKVYSITQFNAKILYETQISFVYILTFKELYKQVLFKVMNF